MEFVESLPVHLLAFPSSEFVSDLFLVFYSFDEFSYVFDPVVFLKEMMSAVKDVAKVMNGKLKVYRHVRGNLV